MVDTRTREDLENQMRELSQSISTMHEKEILLMEKEAHHRGILEDMPLLVCSYLPGGEISFVNKAYCTYFGKKNNDLVGVNFLSLIPQADHEAVMATIKLLSPEAPTQTHEHQVIAPDGTIRWQRWTNRAQFNLQGDVLSYQAIGEDITERKRVEDELKEKNLLFTQVSDNIEDIFWVVDISDPFGFTFLFTNSAFEKTWVRSVEDLYKDPAVWFECIHGEDKERVMSCFINFLKGRGDYNLEFRVTRPDTTLRSIAVKGSLIRDSGGKIVRAVGIARDVTVRRELESKLLQAQKMESIGNLAGGIAHDFNNILSALIGFSELALNEAEPGSTQESDLREVLAAGSRATQLVKQILAFARQSSEDKTPLKVAEIVTEVLKLLRSSLPATIDISHDIQTTSIIMGNSTQLHQIIMNLCTNAAHAMENQGGELKVGLRDVRMADLETDSGSTVEGGPYLELSVSDTGTGIEPSIIGQVFDPYFTTKEVGEGTGMGLAMVKGIIESYGGEIRVESTLFKGSVFKVYLPVTGTESKYPAEIEESYPSGAEHILFVDDEVPIARMGARILESLGYQVSQRNSSSDALELFRLKPNHFDLVITDMTMPHMTGDKLAIELRKIRIDIPIILCTGYSNKMTESKAQQIGIRAFVFKPFTKGDFATTVRAVLDEMKSSPC